MSLVSAFFLIYLVQSTPIEGRFAEIEAGSGGRLGAAIVTPKARHYSRRSERFSLQSVMKMVVAMAALDQVVQLPRWRDRVEARHGDAARLLHADRAARGAGRFPRGGDQGLADRRGGAGSIPQTGG